MHENITSAGFVVSDNEAIWGVGWTSDGWLRGRAAMLRGLLLAVFSAPRASLMGKGHENY